METSNFKKRTQVLLAIGLIAVGIRTLLIFRERHETAPKPQPQNTALDADDYVVAQKLHAYDLKSARQGFICREEGAGRRVRERWGKGARPQR